MNLCFDIGGTWCRIAIFNDKNQITSFKKIKSQNISKDNFIDLIRLFKKKFQIKKIGISGAGQEFMHKIKFTNLNLEIKKKEYFFLNDLEATAYGYLANYENTDEIKEEKILFLNLGTGLGGSLLSIKNSKINVIGSELGHSSESLQQIKYIKFLNFLKTKFKREVEWEDIISGRGIDNIIEFFQNHKVTYKKEDFFKNEKLKEVFLDFLNEFIKDAILFFNIKEKIILCGGVINNNPEFFKNFTIVYDNNEFIKNYNPKIEVCVKEKLNLEGINFYLNEEYYRDNQNAHQINSSNVNEANK